MDKMNRPPELKSKKALEDMERANKLKGVLTQDELYEIADSVMRNYHGIARGGDPNSRAKLKKILELVVLACPDASHYLRGVEEKEQRQEELRRKKDGPH